MSHRSARAFALRMLVSLLVIAAPLAAGDARPPDHAARMAALAKLEQAVAADPQDVDLWLKLATRARASAWDGRSPPSSARSRRPEIARAYHNLLNVYFGAALDSAERQPLHQIDPDYCWPLPPRMDPAPITVRERRRVFRTAQISAPTEAAGARTSTARSALARCAHARRLRDACR